MAEFLAVSALWAPGLIAMVVLTFASGFFSASETALFCLTHDDLRSFRIGSRRQKLAAELLADADRLLTGVLFCNLLVNLTYFSISVMVGQRLVRSGQQLAAGVFSIVGLVLLITFGEVLPKSLGVVWHRSLSQLVSLPLTLVLRLVDPLMPPFQKLTRAIRRTLWPGLTSEPMIRADDLERAVEASHVSEEVVRHERLVLHNILDLSEIPAIELMRPRGTFLMLSPPVSLEALKHRVPAGGFVAVQGEVPGEIHGVVQASGFHAAAIRRQNPAVEDVVCVPWCATAASVLQSLRDEFKSVAVVVNEYGESLGVVTHDDLIDTILSPDPSRARRILHRESIVPLDSGGWKIDGICTLRYLSRRVGVKFEPETDSGLTISGVVFEELQRLPEVGDEILWRGYRVHVTETGRHGRFRALLTLEAAG